MAQAEVEIPQLHFYDLLSKLNPASFSITTLRTRLALSLRGLPYERTALSFPDIAPTLESLGVKANPSGPRYTVPALRIGKDSAPIMDSFEIAKALDKLIPATPEHPALLPDDEAIELTNDVNKTIRAAASSPVAKMVASHTPPVLDDRGAEYFRNRDGARALGDLDEIRKQEKPGEWEEALGSALLPLAELVAQKQGEHGHDGPYASGRQATYGDLVIVALLQSLRNVKGGGAVDPVLEDLKGGVLARLSEAAKPLLR